MGGWGASRAGRLRAGDNTPVEGLRWSLVQACAACPECMPIAATVQRRPPSVIPNPANQPTSWQPHLALQRPEGDHLPVAHKLQVVLGGGALHRRRLGLHSVRREGAEGARLSTAAPCLRTAPSSPAAMQPTLAATPAASLPACDSWRWNTTMSPSSSCAPLSVMVGDRLSTITLGSNLICGAGRAAAGEVSSRTS